MAFPRTPSEEGLYSQMQLGVQAAAAQTFFKPALDARRKHLTDAIVRKARSIDPDPTRKLTDRDCFVFVMALASTYDLEDDLQRIITDGQKAGQHFTK